MSKKSVLSEQENSRLVHLLANNRRDEVQRWMIELEESAQMHNSYLNRTHQQNVDFEQRRHDHEVELEQNHYDQRVAALADLANRYDEIAKRANLPNTLGIEPEPLPEEPEPVQEQAETVPVPVPAPATPASKSRVSVICDDCGQAFPSKKALKAHDCPGPPAEPETEPEPATETPETAEPAEAGTAGMDETTGPEE